MSKLGIVIVDIDSTLADTSHRHGKTPNNDPSMTWRDYSMLCSLDIPIPGPTTLVNLLFEAGYTICLLSGRSVDSEKLTVNWLDRYGINFHSIKLHSPEDPEDHIEYKTSYVQKFIDEDLDVVLALEDWPTLANAYDSMGVPCICINPRYHDDPNSYFVK